MSKRLETKSAFIVTLRAIANVVDEVALLYTRALRKRKGVFLALSIGYLAFAGAFVFRAPFQKAWEAISGQHRADERIKTLEAIVEKQQRIAETLATREQKTSFLRKLEFQETWKNEHNRTEVLRLMDFADFAIQKRDFTRAWRLYDEAAQIQSTLAVPYYRGRLAYLQGDLSEAEANWRQIVETDHDRRYPEIRLYLGVALYEMGREREGKEILKDYL